MFTQCYINAEGKREGTKGRRVDCERGYRGGRDQRGGEWRYDKEETGIKI